MENIDFIYFKIQKNIKYIKLSIYKKYKLILEKIKYEIDIIEKKIYNLEFNKLFKTKIDYNNAYIDIKAGSGGNEAQDWASILLRMYLKWAENHNFQTELIEFSLGDMAGIKSATIHVKGDYVFGWLRTESGIHRLVRKSPFDYSGRRHTSFASIFVSPELDESIKIDINPGDLRIDTYRSSGSGGQHVNTTDSAVRITHELTGIVVCCQSERSQHANKEHAMKILKSKLYEREIKKKIENKKITNLKLDIGWGSQIRSYILDNQIIKDLRTGVQNSNCNKVLSGDIDFFIKESIKYGF
ncbi:Peptide chain release factor 2 [Candidatus Johnevansia muelleri]|uniref:Peptide chain release factor 2 n=1 Tax=Candidatus Johnevansia muelleri TaxID=1495769 RepID=A0A078KEF4_9GAMM|nr:Peptide chain release factor 2 [Candidatus Evansia muelleri]